jgi:hypothetical protein
MRTFLAFAAVAAILGLATVGLVTFGGDSVDIERPSYDVVERLDGIEIRQYAPYLVAETTVDGDLEDAGNRGFRILAKYIFGDNQGAKEIAMTAPVSQEKAGGSKIAMTAPVTQERVGDEYTVQFMMPSEYSRDDLPQPNDARVTFREVPSRTFAAVRYSGTWSKRNYDKHLDALVTTLLAKGYEPTGEPIWARYNPPFMPWFMRRNEILTQFRTVVSQR